MNSENSKRGTNMIDSIAISSAGMTAQSEAINSISNNLANINSISYKKKNVSFSSLIYQVGNETGSKDILPRKSGGVSSSKIKTDFSVGSFKQTGKPLDLVINGSGFFELINKEGNYLYTRNGSLTVNSDGYIATHDGHVVSQMISVPKDAQGVKIDANGDVKIKIKNENDVLIGKIEVYSFVNPNGLEAMSGGIFKATDKSGEPQFVENNEDTATIVQGYLESSNVSMVDELTSMMLAKQAYSLNSRSLKISDEILSIINNLNQG